MRKLLALSLLLLVGCTIDANGIRIDIPQWGKVTPVVVPPRPDEPPIQSGKLRALIIDDNTDQARAKLTPDQRQVLFKDSNPSVKDFLTANCIESKDSEGATDEGWRHVHKGQDLPGVWAEMLARYPPQSFPWLILVNGDSGIGVAIESEKQLTPLLNKYAGVKQ